MDGITGITLTIAALACARADALRAPGDVLPRAPLAPGTVVVDPWFGDDKFRHFAMSFAATTFAYAAVRTAGADRDAALPVALAASAGAGVGKELFDRRQGKIFSLRDLVWDALGTAAGYALVKQIR